jgi:hypothetical protein
MNRSQAGCWASGTLSGKVIIDMNDAKLKLDENQTAELTTGASRPKRPLVKAALLVFVCLGVGAGILSALYFGRTGKPKTSEIVQNWEDRKSVKISHDFGLLRARQKVHHRFSIANDSTIPWTLSEIKHTCKCTTGQPRSQSVLPGEKMEIDVDYQAPDINKEDTRQIGVGFAEPGVPYFWLVVHCTAREAIAASPRGLLLEVDSIGHVEQQEVTISSYLDHDVRQPQITSSVPWLKAELRPAPVLKERYPARQSWQARVAANTSGLRPGKYLVQFEIRTDDPDAPCRVVPVELLLSDQLEVVPRELTFGSIPPGKEANRKVLIKLRKDVNPLRARDVKVEHDLGESLKVSCRELSASVLEVSAALSAAKSNGSGHLRGVVRLSFKGDSLVPLEIPISAEIK